MSTSSAPIAPAATHDRAVVDLQPIGKHRDAGLPRWTLLQPMLQCGHVDDRLVRLDAIDRQVVAARTHRRPWQRQGDTIRAQERSGDARFACDDVPDHERWHRRQAVLAAGRTDFQPERAANLIQDQARRALRLSEVAEQHGDQRQQQRWQVSRSKDACANVVAPERGCSSKHPGARRATVSRQAIPAAVRRQRLRRRTRAGLPAARRYRRSGSGSRTRAPARTPRRPWRCHRAW